MYLLIYRDVRFTRRDKSFNGGRGGGFRAIVEYSLIYLKVFFLIKKNPSNIHLVLHKKVYKQSYNNTQK